MKLTTVLLLSLTFSLLSATSHSQCVWNTETSTAWDNTDYSDDFSWGPSGTLTWKLFQPFNGPIGYNFVVSTDVCGSIQVANQFQGINGPAFRQATSPLTGFTRLDLGFNSGLTTVGIAYSSSDRRHNYLAYTPNSGADEYARMYVKLNPFQWNMVGLPMNPENKPFAYFLLDDIFQTPPTVGTVVCRWNYFTGGYITSTYSFNSATASNEWSNPMLFWRGESFWIRPMGESSLRIQGDHPVAGTQVSLNPGQNQIALASPLRNWLNNLGLPAVSGDKISLLSSTGWKHSTYQSGGFWSPNLGVEPGQGIILTRTQNSNVTWMPSLGYQP